MKDILRPKTTTASNKEIESQVLSVVAQLLKESGSDAALAVLSPKASFEGDLALGSLERVELLIRIEEFFAINLPDSSLAKAENPGELAEIVMRAGARVSKKNTSPVKSKGPLGASAFQEAQTLNEALFHHVDAEPERPHIYLIGEEDEEKTLTYSDVLRGASAVARALLSKGISKGEPVALMLPTGESFFYTFLGILLAGAIPVPVYPPIRAKQMEAYAKSQEAILSNAGAVALITFKEVAVLAKLLRPRVPSLRFVLLAENLSAGEETGGSFDLVIRTGDPALIQYTSGSTGQPKGVYLTHQNLLANIRSMKKAMQLRPDDVGVSWLPLYHDMGLIGSWLFSLVNGLPIAIMSPLAFLSRPERWLWAMHRHRGSISAAPNFAYQICAQKIKDKNIEGLDLSSWRIALNGAEPVRPETLQAFSERFADYGFRPESHFPVYGMAEASVGLSFPPLDRLPRIDRIDRNAFQVHQDVKVAGPNAVDVLEFVSCGMPLPDHEIRIADHKGLALAEDKEGQVEFKGPSCTSGYYQNPEATALLFHDGWHVSGDLGYLSEGELFITGRSKDIIIKGGRNLHPFEIEAVVGDIPKIRKGCVAAFGLDDAVSGTQKLVVVAETRETDFEEKTALIQEINLAVSHALSLPPDEVKVVAPGAIPKTSSGKVSRSSCRRLFLERQLDRKPTSVSIQFVKLSLTWFRSWSQRGFRYLKRLCYGAYLVSLLLFFLPPLWALIMLKPKKKTGAILKGAAQFFLSCAFAKPDITGPAPSKLSGSAVWISNHASYLDVCFLIATLPAGLRFVAKAELLKVPILKTFLKKGDHITVDRDNLSNALTEFDRMTKVLNEGHSVLIFPEGTFRKSAGLRPFKLGAFKAAVETGRPLVPIVLKGTRTFLPAGSWLPKATEVSLTFKEPLYPEAGDWREVVRLREEARETMAKLCEEIALK